MNLEQCHDLRQLEWGWHKMTGRTIAGQSWLHLGKIRQRRNRHSTVLRTVLPFVVIHPYSTNFTPPPSLLYSLYLFKSVSVPVEMWCYVPSFPPLEGKKRKVHQKLSLLSFPYWGGICEAYNRGFKGETGIIFMHIWKIPHSNKLLINPGCPDWS